MITKDTIDRLLRSADVIKTETQDGANTARRVGMMFIDIINELNNAGGGSGSAIDYKRLDDWDSYDPSMAGWVLSAALGVDLYNRILNNNFFEKVQIGGGEAEPTYAIRLKPEYKGLYSEGFLSTYGLNGSGSGSGGSGGITEITKKMVTDALGFTPFDVQNFTKSNIKNELGIYDWALESRKPDYFFDEISGVLSFAQLPNVYWANLPLQERKNTNTAPIFGSVQIGDAIISWNPEKQCLFVSKGFVSESFLSAYGINEGGSGGGSAVNLSPNEWTKKEDFADNLALASNLGWGLYDAMNTVAVSLADFDERLKAMGIAIENAGEKLTFPTTGSGNAVTSVTKSGTTVTITKGSTFLTGNQTITLSGDVTGSGTTAITTSIGAGKVTNAKLANSAITINGTSTSLGGSFRTATITAGSAGTSSATSGYTLSVPYVTMNAYGIVTGYGAHTHTVNNIPNTSLQNSSMTLWGNTVSLGGSTNGSITIKNGSKSVTLSVDTSGCLKVDAGMYSTSFISAYGLSSSSAITSSGGAITNGHLYLDGASVNSSTANKTQLVFRASETQQVVLSSNKDKLVINPSTTLTNGQIELGVNGSNTIFHGASAKVAVNGFLRVGTDDVTSWSGWKMYVNGTGYISGEARINGNLVCNSNITYSGTLQKSDVRLKNVGKNVDLNVADIALAPCFVYTLKNDSASLIHVGSSAQYWQHILTDAVREDEQGWLGLDYTAVTMASVIALAKRSESHEDRIKRLERENEELKKKIVELERA